MSVLRQWVAERDTPKQSNDLFVSATSICAARSALMSVRERCVEGDRSIQHLRNRATRLGFHGERSPGRHACTVALNVMCTAVIATFHLLEGDGVGVFSVPP